jgi:hypothetical protein
VILLSALSALAPALASGGNIIVTVLPLLTLITIGTLSWFIIKHGRVLFRRLKPAAAKGIEIKLPPVPDIRIIPAPKVVPTPTGERRRFEPERNARRVVDLLV